MKPRVTITVTKTLEPCLWGPDLESLTDEELIELAREDLIGFIDGASWKVERQVL